MINDLEQITIYTPRSRSGGLLSTAVSSVRDIHKHRHLVWSLFSRDFRAQFKQNLLGYFWTVITPLLGVLGFVYLNYTGLLNPGPMAVPYVVYAFAGTSMWGMFTGTFGIMAAGLNSQSELIMRTNIPKIALAASAFASIFYNALVSVILILLSLVLFHVRLSLVDILFPVLLLPLLIFGAGIGLMASVLGIIIKDATRIINVFISILMYMTPVIFVSDKITNPVLHRLIVINPLTYLIDFPRSLILTQGVSYWERYAAASALSILVLLVGVKVFDVVQDLVAERL